jgi:hypothetical protein
MVVISYKFFSEGRVRRAPYKRSGTTVRYGAKKSVREVQSADRDEERDVVS